MWSEYLNVNIARACFYEQWEGPRNRYARPILTGAQLRPRASLLSPKAIARLKLAINTLVHTASYKTVYEKASGKSFRFKVNFVTLTLPSSQKHTDSEIVKLALSPFLEAWSKRAKGLLYVWKAEVQDNGNIHFHITTNTFIHYAKLRHRWNFYMEKLGYLQPEKLDTVNSTDVHSTKNIKRLANYLCAYVSKKDLYTRSLKRYFVSYRKQLADTSKIVHHLPKNYFKRLKRRLSCPLWGASKCLLKPTFQVDLAAPEYKREVQSLLKAKDFHIKTGHALIIPFEGDALSALPYIWNDFQKNLKPVYAKQKLVQSIYNY